MPDNFVNVQIQKQKTSSFTHTSVLAIFSTTYFANEERFQLFLADAELGDVIGGIPKCLIHHIVGIH